MADQASIDELPQYLAGKAAVVFTVEDWERFVTLLEGETCRMIDERGGDSSP